MVYIIYKTTNLINGKYYVGQHNTSANDSYIGSGLILEKAIKKYGKENFQREILEICNKQNKDEREIYWINKLSATNQEIGYNLHNGGIGGNLIEWTEERRNERKGNKNIAKRPEVREKISKFWKGRKRSLENCKKYSEIKKGKKLSNEIRIKKSCWNYKFTNIKTGEIIMTDALGILCEKNGWNRGTINGAICRKRFKYKEWKIERSLKGVDDGNI